MDRYNFIEKRLERQRSLNLFRRLQNIKPLSGVEVEIDGRKLINFASNDYLGLSKHPLLEERAIEFMKRYGAGSTASRLVSGSFECFDMVETRIAGAIETEGALIFNSGFQANISLLPALADKETLILSDCLNHNSLIQGSLLSRCRIEQFQHNNLNHLTELLKKARAKGSRRILVITESVFSMDGDQCDIDSLADLSSEYEFFLVLDEAHAVGILGKNGMGLSCGKNVDLIMGTFSKACGSFGAYVACDKSIKDYLINFCYGLIYTTALPPSVIGSIDAALELIPEMEAERRDLLLKAENLRSSLRELGYDTGNSTTHIIPVIIGDEKDTLEVSRWLKDEGRVLAVTFRPPTVGHGESRIRIALSAAHTQDHVDLLVDLFRTWRDRN